MQYCNAYVTYQGRRARARGCKWTHLSLRDCGVTQDSECERDAVWRSLSHNSPRSEPDKEREPKLYK